MNAVDLTKTKTHPAYRPDIDGMRAVAVLSVVVYHAFPILVPSGFIGVDMFFVISGFLITLILINNANSGSLSILDFYSRRIKRIIPALLVVFISCLTLGWFALLADEFQQLGAHVVAGIGFVSNLVLWSEDGYFDNASETKTLLHLWSLGIEEQFYIAWPLIVGFFCRRKLNLLGCILLLLVASFSYNIYLINIDATATFYSPLTRVWELLAGSLLAFVTINRSPIQSGHTAHNIYRNISSGIGVVLLLIGFFTISSNALFPGAWALLPVVGCALLILGGPHAWINSKLLSNKPIVWIGLISYPLYLWHWPLLSLANVSLSETPHVAVRVVLVLTSISLPWCTYLFIEKPIRKGEVKRFVTSILVVLMVITAIIGGTIAYNDGFRKRSAVTNSDFTTQVADQFAGALWEYTSNDECINSYDFKDAAQYRWWFCMKSSPSDPTILLYGNSYANQLYPGFVNNEQLQHHTILSIGACDYAHETKVEGDISNPCHPDNALKQKKHIGEIVQTHESLQYIVIDGLRSVPHGSYIQRLSDNIQSLKTEGHEGKTIIIFIPHLRPVENPKSCFTMPLRPTANDCTIPGEIRQALNSSFQPLIDEIKKVHPEVHFFDQNSVFCQNSSCSGILNGMPLHRDMKHISEYASIQLQTHFTQWARKNIPQLFGDN